MTRAETAEPADKRIGEGRPKIRLGDAFAPYFRVEFIVAEETQTTFTGADGEEFSPVDPNNPFGDDPFGSVYAQLSTNSRNFDVLDGGRLGHIRSFATSLEVTVKAEGASKAVLRIEPPLEDALKIIDDPTIQFNAVMKVQFGWLPSTPKDEGINSKVYLFSLQPPQIEINGTDVTLTLVGVESFTNYSIQNDNRRKFPRTQFETDLKILKEILLPLGMTINHTLVPATVERGGQQVPHPLFAIKGKRATVPVAGTGGRQLVRIREGVIEQNERDWIFFNRMVTRNNCSWFVVGAVVFIVDRNAARVQPTGYRFVQMQQIRDERDVPMFSFGTNLLPHYLVQPPASRGIRQVVADPDTGEVDVTEFDPAKSSFEVFMAKRTRTGRIGTGATVIKVGDTTIVPNPPLPATASGGTIAQPAGTQDGAESARQVARQASDYANTNASATVPGLPNLLPWDTVRVEGVGQVLSGAYYVREIVHSFQVGDGYETQVKLLRNSSSGDPEAGGGKPASNVQPPATASGSPTATPTDADA